MNLYEKAAQGFEIGIRLSASYPLKITPQRKGGETDGEYGVRIVRKGDRRGFENRVGL